MHEQDLEIVPGERIGPYYLKWDIGTLKKNLPKDYVVTKGYFFWYVEFEDYLIGIRKIDNQIDFITVKNQFSHNFKGKITCKTTLGQIEEEFGETKDCTYFATLPAYPGMEIYLEDDEGDDDDDDSWKNVKVKSIAVREPDFIWDNHFSAADYEKMEKTDFECPFPKDKLIHDPQ